MAGKVTSVGADIADAWVGYEKRQEVQKILSEDYDPIQELLYQDGVVSWAEEIVLSLVS